MKKILLSMAVFGLSFGYEGCGIDKKDALNALSQSIYVNVNNQFTKNEEVHQGFVDFFSKSVTNNSSQSSNLTLKNVKFVNKNGKVCAEVNKQAVQNSANETLKYLLSFNVDALPSEFEAKQKQANDVLNKISFVRAILNIDSYKIEKLTNLEKQLKDIVTEGAVVISSNVANSKIKISGKTDYFAPSELVLLKSGKYSYTISATGYESENGTFEIIQGKKTSINVNLSSKKDLKSIENKDNYYMKSKELDINYGYAVSSTHKEWDGERRIGVRLFNNYGIYKLGFGVLAGTQKSWTAKDMNELEFTISGRVQFPTIGNTTLSIGQMPVIPFVGVEGGWDMYKFIDRFSDFDSDNITTVFRGTTGFTILIHKQFGFNVIYSHDFAEKKDNIISAGLVMDF